MKQCQIPNLLWPFTRKFGLSDWDYFLLIIQSRRHLSSGFMFNRREELGFVNLTLEELVFVNLTVQHLKEKKKNIGCRAGVCRLRTVQALDDLRSSSEPWKHFKTLWKWVVSMHNLQSNIESIWGTSHELLQLSHTRSPSFELSFCWSYRWHTHVTNLKPGN